MRSRVGLSFLHPGTHGVTLLEIYPKRS